MLVLIPAVECLIALVCKNYAIFKLCYLNTTKPMRLYVLGSSDSCMQYAA